MKRFLGFLLLAVLLLPTQSTHAQDLGIAVRAGTTGVGGEVSFSPLRKLTLRGHYSTFSLNVSDTVGGTDGDDDFEMNVDGEGTIGAMVGFLDFHPFANSFRLTVGAGTNMFDATGTAIAAEPVCFGDEINGVCDGKEFSPDRLGQLTAKVGYTSSIHPYAGIGFGNAARGRSRVTFLFDLGVYYTGQPEIELENNGLFEPTTDPDNVQTLNDGFKDFVLYPVLTIGFGIRL